MKINNKVTVGILGGMGPYASLAFMKKLLHLTEAKKDWDHLRIIMDSNPHIPSRSRAFIFNEESPVAGMIKSCKKLQDYPVDLILLPCNSATYFLPDVQKEINVPILSIVEATCNRIKNRFQKNSRIIVWGGVITYTSHLYAPYLKQLEYEYVEIDKIDNEIVVSCIEDIKVNNEKTDINRIKFHIENMLKKYNSTAIILGCSEFGCVVEQLSMYPIIDSDTEYAKYVIKLINYDV